MRAVPPGCPAHFPVSRKEHCRRHVEKGGELRYPFDAEATSSGEKVRDRGRRREDRPNKIALPQAVFLEQGAHYLRWRSVDWFLMFQLPVVEQLAEKAHKLSLSIGERGEVRERIDQAAHARRFPFVADRSWLKGGKKISISLEIARVSVHRQSLRSYSACVPNHFITTSLRS